jgi:small subunit ribosomal protein S8
MSVTDPIADMLTSIRNAGRAGQKTTEVPHSKMKLEIARILKKEGFIGDYTTEGQSGKRVLRIYLKYANEREPIIRNLKKISKCGCRKYSEAAEIPRVFGGIGISILSTSSGLMTGDEARRKNVGGEVLCYVW